MYEIELKSLLGDKNNADSFRTALLSKGAIKTTEAYSQLNHYFMASKSNLLKVVDSLEEYLSTEKHDELMVLAREGLDYSVRTRAMEDKVIFVVKASVDDTTSENGIARREFEESVNLSLDELDSLLIDAGCHYQAKWSRTREEYKYQDITVCLDKNAGYGYLVEFELVVDDVNLLNNAEKQVRKAMEEFELRELNQDRLARMFEFYNKNWSDYYGTENIFTVE